MIAILGIAREPFENLFEEKSIVPSVIPIDYDSL